MRSIKVNYRTIIQQRRLGDKLYVLETIRNLDEAIDDLCDVLSDDDKRDPFAEDLCPYFGILWPAAEALAVYLYHHPDLVKNKSVLELGCGLGYPSIVATVAGGEVLATDFHPDVENYFQRNCRHSSVECKYRRLNWRDDKLMEGPFDVVMGSDVLYESKHAIEVAKGLIRFLKPGGRILLSDPGRNYLQPFLTAMQSLGFHEHMEGINIEGKEIFVFLFTRTTEYIE